jgi:hypothetical protein
VSIELLGNLLVTSLPVTDGTATFEPPMTSESLDPGTYEFFAYCSDASDPETGFEYEDVATQTVVAPTTTTAAPATSAPAAAAAAATRPAFTG